MSAIPAATVGRLVTYQRILQELEASGVSATSSDELGQLANVTAFQVRKDLAYFGRFGTRGAGYAVVGLRQELVRILGLGRAWNVAIMGMGRLGQALADYPNFDRIAFRLVAAFDVSPQQIGQRYGDLTVEPVTALAEVVRERAVDLAFLTVPASAAQAAAEATGGKGGIRSTFLLRMRRQRLAQQLEETSKEFDQVAKEVTALGNANADLEARRNEIAQLQAVTNQMGIQLNASEVDIAMPNRVELLEEARVPGDGEELFRLMLTVLAALAGFGAGVGGVVLLEYLRDRLSTAEQMPQRLGVRVLGTVPRVSRSRKKPNTGEVAESVDGVRTIISQSGRESPRVIIVTSAMEHEGKTTFAAQFAASLARAGSRTLLLDGDLRHPNVHLALELDLRSGLPELLRGEITVDEAVQPTSIEGLFAITGGACDYASITALSKPETARILKELRGSFDQVVIDAGPVLAFADVLLLGQLSDAAIMVTMRDVSRLPLVTKAVDRLRSVGIRVIGTVVNGVTDTSPRQLYASQIPA
jgi:capsular exopolysaccharide synthesis family protein